MSFATLPPHYAAIIFGFLCLYPVYKTFQRTGLKPWPAFFVLIPFFGLLIVMAILAHRPWTTVPPLKKKKET